MALVGNSSSANSSLYAAAGRAAPRQTSGCLSGSVAGELVADEFIWYTTKLMGAHGQRGKARAGNPPALRLRQSGLPFQPA
jgi:hypothetical protein